MKVNVKEIQDEPSVAVASFFKGFRATDDTSFQLYRNKRSHEQFILHGENERLEYEGTTDSKHNSSQYVVGIFNKKKQCIELFKTPMVSGKVISKAKKNLAGPAIKQKGSTVRGSVLRNALGEAFGTKKAKKAIVDLERNRIDADKLTEAAIDIVDTVKNASSGLPTRSEMELTVANDRPTPVANLDATDVEQIYPIENIIPKRELAFIRVGPIFKEKSIEGKLELLPFGSESKYIAKKLNILQEVSQTTKLQLLYYLSLLMGVYINRRINDKNKLLEKLNNPPESLVDGILERFTIVRPGQFGRSKERSYFIDPQNEDKLLCFMLAIMLHLDNFLVEIQPLAQEMGLKPSKVVSLFRILGCVVKGATVAQAEAFGIPKSAASTYKIASLRVPFKLPEMTRRGRAARR